LLCAPRAVAQSADGYSLDRSTIVPGGTGTGGDFSLTSTVGQPAADVLSTGDFTLTAGFLAIMFEGQSPAEPPRLNIELDPANGTLTVSWPLAASDYVLEQASALNQSNTTWSSVLSPYQTNATRIFITI